MVLVALALRLVVMVFLLPEQLDPQRDHWPFGYETGRIARSIVEGRGFSSPLFGDTGPTAWMTPVYPYFVAGVFRLFGTYTKASALVLLSAQGLISALNCAPIFYFALKLFGRRAALWSGWAWAFFPYAVYFPEERIWSTWLSTALFSVLFLWTLYLEQTPRLSRWIGIGLLWGLTALTDPIVLAAWPFMNGWACYRMQRQKQRWAWPLAASVFAMIIAVSPWFVRNYEVFGKFIPFRDNAGLEIHSGNSGETFHWRPRMLGPWHNDEEWKAFKEIGEIGYMEREKQRGVEFIRTHPRWFAVVTVRRFVYIWTGFWSFDERYLAEEPLDPPNIFFCTALTVMMLIGLRRVWRENRSIAVLFAMVLFFFPAIYYVTHVEVYFRRQIDPLIVTLAVYGVLPKTAEAHDFASEPGGTVASQGGQSGSTV
ncbi:MAG TPA: hypothetical protein VKH18_04545 [Terriglobales bacterium]|nr:hypothetical protein [Terriglobales bacterium]